MDYFISIQVFFWCTLQPEHFLDTTCSLYEVLSIYENHMHVRMYFIKDLLMLFYLLKDELVSLIFG
jgi:hypothetical protein